MKTKNSKLLKEFYNYCQKHPKERFWQCLRNWSGFSFIYVTNEPTREGETFDTFYFEEKSK